MTIHEELMRLHPIRYDKAQKQAFREWAVEQAGKAGYKARVEETSRMRQKNVIIGDPDKAAVLFTAHYDTPADMVLPDMKFPRNIPAAAGWQALIILLDLLISGVVVWLVHFFISDFQFLFGLFILGYVVILYLMSRGPANKQNANASSGVAAALQLMASLPAEDRAKCAFILFDGNYRGRAGSKGWTKDHLELAWMRLAIDLDKVGVGDHALLISADMARRCTGFHTLQKVLSETPGLTAHFCDSKTSLIEGDSRSFKCGVELMVAERRPVLGYTIGRLGTRRDTLCDQRNLDWAVTALCSFIARMGKE